MNTTEQEFIKAYEAYADAIFRHCYFRVRDRDLAKDLTQEAFTRTWSYIASGKEIDNLRAFLYKTATNQIIDYSRKKSSSSLDELQTQGFEPVGRDEVKRLQISIDADYVKKVLATLEPKYQEVVTLRYVNDMRPKEIANLLGETENAISVRIHRGLKQLHDLLNSHE